MTQFDNYFQQKTYQYLPIFTTNITKFYELTANTKKYFQSFSTSYMLEKSSLATKTSLYSFPLFQIIECGSCFDQSGMSSFLLCGKLLKKVAKLFILAIRRLNVYLYPVFATR